MQTSRNDGLVRVAGLIGMTVPILSTAIITLAISRASWFSWTGNYLSDLGVHQGSSAIFNYGLMLSGALTTVFAIGLMRYLEGSGLFTAGKLLFLTSSLSLIAVGIFNEDYGAVHFAVSFAFFFLAILSILILGMAFRKRKDSVGTVLVCLALAGGMMWALPWPGRGGALPEATSILFMSMFSIIIGARMYRSP